MPDTSRAEADAQPLPAQAALAHPAVSGADVYRLLVETVTDYAIFVLDPSGRVASWNAGAERLKGYTSSEIIGRGFSVFFPEEDVRAGKPAQELEAARREGRAEYEGWRVRKDGSRFWADVVITALHDASGRLVGFAKVTRDLTERRESEERARRLAAEGAARAAVERQNQELAQLAEQLQQQAIELEQQMEEAQALTEELESTNSDLAEALAQEEAARGRAETAEQRMRYLLRAGDILAASLEYEDRLRELAHLVIPELADWCAVEVVGDDGTASTVAVAHVDPDKVKWAAEVSRRYPSDPNADTGVPKVLRTGQPELYANITDDLLEKTAVDAEHLRLVRELRMVSAMIVPLVAHDRIFGALTLVSAESGRHYGQEDLDFALELARRAALAVDNARAHSAERLAREEAEAANRAKMDFLAVMSHELRTPLNAIAGYAELLRMGVRGPVTGQQAEDLERILRSERALLSLINDVLNYAKLEAGRVEFELTAVPVVQVLRDIEPLIQPQLLVQQLTFENAACDPALSVRADADKLRQILLNLLSNAIKFTPPGGRITVGCDAPVARGAGRKCVSIYVRDTGIGIPPEKMAAVFEPFVQVDPALTRTRDGTGLGLSISRDLARAMHGDITAVSEVGKGSTFTITLPRP